MTSTSVPVATKAMLDALQAYVDSQIIEHGGGSDPQGAAGVPGSQNYSRTAAPVSNVGINGDWWPSTMTSDLYERPAAAG